MSIVVQFTWHWQAVFDPPFCNGYWGELLCSLASIELQLQAHLLTGQDKIQVTHQPDNILNTTDIFTQSWSGTAALPHSNALYSSAF